MSSVFYSLLRDFVASRQALMAEIEASLLAKLHEAGEIHERPVLVGFLRSRKKRIGTLIEARDGQSLKELKREVKKKGGKKIKVYKEINTLYAEMPVDKVTDLASVSCAQKVYDAEGDIKPCLNESVPLVMGVEKWQLPHRVKRRKIEGKGVKVAVIDDGIDKKHSDLAWRIKRVKKFNGGRKYKGANHGTVVAGIIAGSGKSSGYRYVGVAPKVKLYVAKVFKNLEPIAPRSSILDAILWAVKKKVEIINISLGGQGCSNGTCPVCQMADYAVRQGITVVVAAGNEGPLEGTTSCPGNAKLAITVGASTKTPPIVVTSFSSRGSTKFPGKPDLVAPGHDIMASQAGGGYTLASGTSMATPHVAGLAALLYQSEKYLKGKKRVTPAEIKHVLKQGCTHLGESFITQGSGLVNFIESLQAIEPPRRFTWRLRKKKKKLQPVVQHSQQPESTELQNTTCPAIMNMFCPYYDQHTCNEVYETCIYYQIGNQTKTLHAIKTLHEGPSKSPATESKIT